MGPRPEDLLRALGDATRLRCVSLLQAEGELCVCELTHATGASQPKVSRHLAVLREAGIVADRRDGVWIHYRLHPGLPPWALACIAGACDGARELAPFREDRVALAAMPNRPGARCCA